MSDVCAAGGVASTGIVWSTLCDVDFTTCGTRTLSPDGNYTIGGQVFTKTNSAQDNANTTLDPVNGVTFTPKSTADNWNAVQNFPRLVVSLAGVVVGPTTRVRAWVRMTGNYTTAYDQTILQFQNTTFNSHVAWERNFYSGGIKQHAQATWYSVSGEAPFLADTGADVFVVELLYGFGDPWRVVMSTGVWSGGWPAAILPRFWYEYNWNVVQGVAAGYWNQWEFAFGAARNGGSANFAGKFGAVKVEYAQ